MAGSRTLKLSILADIDNLQKNLKTSGAEVDSFGNRMADFGKKAAVAFAAAGAAIGAFAVSAVKAAAEDEAAQLKLAETIRSTTKATDDQIAGVERYITKTSIAAGITDDQLRPAFSRLVRSTNDVEDAQKLLNLALDLSSATGKPLEAVTNALGRAYDGNTTALGKLGLGISAADLKSQDFDTTFNQLTKTFGQFSENEAQSTQKQMERVKIALDEAKESIGAALLPVVQELTAFLLEKFIPALEAFIAGLTGQQGLDQALTDSQKTAMEWGKKVRGFIDTVIDLKDELFLVAGVLATVFVVSKIAAGVQATILLIQGLVAAYVALRNSAVAAAIASRFALNPLAGLATGAAVVTAIMAAVKMFDNQANAAAFSGANTVSSSSLPEGFTTGREIVKGGGTISTGGGLTTIGGGSASGTAIKPPTQTLIEQVTQENFLRGLSNPFDVAGFRRGEEKDRVVINISGAIDPVGTARQVANILNTEASTAGSFTNLGVSRFATRAE